MLTRTSPRGARASGAETDGLPDAGGRRGCWGSEGSSPLPLPQVDAYVQLASAIEVDPREALDEGIIHKQFPARSNSDRCTFIGAECGSSNKWSGAGNNRGATEEFPAWKSRRRIGVHEVIGRYASSGD